MTLEELKEKVESVDLFCCTDLDKVIVYVTNLLIDYDNEHKGYIFEDLYYRFEDEEILFEDIKNAPDLSTIGNIIRYVKSFDEYFYLYDETYGWENYTDIDVKEWINDIVWKIDFHLDEEMI